MTFAPRQSVRSGLDHLETRLDPIIATRLADDLHGLPWTTVLTELDRAKGKPPRQHNPADIQSQLRMLTERLGGLGFPFDTDRHRPRYVSSLAGELRIMRNAEKHNDEISTIDAWRFHDTCVRLLEVFDDKPGLPTVNELSREALTAVVAESGLTPARRDSELTVEAGEPTTAGESTSEPHESAFLHGTGEVDLVEPDAEVLIRDDAESTPTIGATRPSFDAWVPTILGNPDVIDNVARRVNKDRVRAAATEIAEFEGPIHIDRLTRLVAISFGVGRLASRRQQKIGRQVRQLGLTVDTDNFIWPFDLDPAQWTEFRPNTSEVGREFTHISPVEIANAQRFLQSRTPGLDGTELEAAVLRTFGRKRRTKSVVAHLTRAAAVVA